MAVCAAMTGLLIAGAPSLRDFSSPYGLAEPEPMGRQIARRVGVAAVRE